MNECNALCISRVDALLTRIHGVGVPDAVRMCTQLCGCQYGSASLMIHIRACQQKWLAAESVKPARERRPLPAPPPEIAAGELPSGQAADDFNQSMAEWVTHMQSHNKHPHAVTISTRMQSHNKSHMQ